MAACAAAESGAAVEKLAALILVLERVLVLFTQPVVGLGRRHGAVAHGDADLVQAFHDVSGGEDAGNPAVGDASGRHATSLGKVDPELLRQA